MFLLLWNEAVALESSSDDGSDQDYVQSAPVISSYVCVCVCVCVCVSELEGVVVGGVGGDDQVGVVDMIGVDTR